MKRLRLRWLPSGCRGVLPLRGLAVAGLISLVFLFLTACGGGEAGDPDAFEDLPTLSFDDAGVVPPADGDPAAVATRVAGTIAAQDNELATAVAEGVDRVLRHGEEEPTPTPFFEDEVRVPVFRRGDRAQRVSGSGTPFPTPTPTPVPTPTPAPTATLVPTATLLPTVPAVPTATPTPAPAPAASPVPGPTAAPPPAGPGPCPDGLDLHSFSGREYSLCYPSGWLVGTGNTARRFEEPESRARVELRLLNAPPAADENWLFDWFTVEVAENESADAEYRVLESGMGEFSGRYGGQIEYLHDAGRPYSCLERVTARVYLSDYHPDVPRGYAVMFAACEEYWSEFSGLRSGVLSGFSEYGR